MALILLGHILGDFYLQTDKMAQKKKTSFFYMFLHCLFYFIIMYIMFRILTRNDGVSAEISCIISIIHLCIDMIKNRVGLEIRKYEYTIFLIDQVIHILSLMIIFTFYESNILVNLSGYTFYGTSYHKIVVILIAILICYKPASVLVSLLLREIWEKVEQEKPQNQRAGETVEVSALIGIFEREIILLLGLMGQYGAIGFVLAAKSLARYKQLEDKSFAEKYLVGTLLSCLIAFLCLGMCSFIS